MSHRRFWAAWVVATAFACVLALNDGVDGGYGFLLAVLYGFIAGTLARLIATGPDVGRPTGKDEP